MTTKVQLFITCLAEQFFPGVLEKMVFLLERSGVQPVFPPDQTCCGQPFYNSGFQTEARKMAENWLRIFSRLDYPIVSPSGSCVDMVRHHYPELFPPESPDHRLAIEIASRTFEFTEFMVHQQRTVDLGGRFPHKVTYHASCHLARGLGIREEPKHLLRAVKDLELLPLPEEDTCCGFGGVFSVIFPPVSKAMMDAKIANIQACGADVVVACDAGCLMNIAGGLRKAGSPIKAMHIIEVLASQQEVS